MKRLLLCILTILLLSAAMSCCTIVKSDGTYLTYNKNSKNRYVGGNIDRRKHKCRWDKCPYKVIVRSQWSSKVTEYTGCQYGDDCHVVDMLHLIRPRWGYEKIHKTALIYKN